MKVLELLEAEEPLAHVTVLGAMLQKLMGAGKVVNVMVYNQKDGGKPKSKKRPEIGLVKKVELNAGVRGGPADTRIYTSTSQGWFDLLPDDDAALAVRRQEDGSWLLQGRDGKPVQV